MKAEIDEYGTLTITPEGKTESYALTQWYMNWNEKTSDAILCIDVNTTIGKKLMKNESK